MIEPDWQVNFALSLARMVHTGQYRVGGEEYINHPIRVAQAVAHLGREYEIVGYLHDTLEDDQSGLVNYDLLETYFGHEIADAVESVSRREDEVYMDMIRRARANTIGRAVKLADNIDNTNDSENLPEERKLFQQRRYARARAILEAG